MHVCFVTLGSAPFAPTEYLFLAMLLLHKELKLIKPRLKLLRFGSCRGSKTDNRMGGRYEEARS